MPPQAKKEKVDTEHKPNSSNPRVTGGKQNVNTQGGESQNAGGGSTTFGKHAQMPVLVSDLYVDVQLPDLQEFDPSQIKLDVRGCSRQAPHREDMGLPQHYVPDEG